MSKSEKSAIEDIMSGPPPAPPKDIPPKPATPVAAAKRSESDWVPMEHLGRLSLRDKYASRRYWPMGPSVTRLVDKGPTNTVVVEARPEVKFESHMYATDDPDIALALVSDQGNFERAWGFHVNEEGLPNPVKGKFRSLHLENRRRVMIALVRGATGEEALASIDKKLQDIARQEQPGAPAVRFICPVPGCGKEAAGTGDDAKSALMVHVRTQHPDYTGAV